MQAGINDTVLISAWHVESMCCTECRCSCGELYYMRVDRHYFDMSPQIWIAKDVSTFANHIELIEFLRENDISCIIAVDALLTFRLFKGRPTSNKIDSRLHSVHIPWRHMHTHNRFTALLEYVWHHLVSRYQKGKTRKVTTNLDLLEQEIVSGSGICWTICNAYSLRPPARSPPAGNTWVHLP